MGFIDHQYNLSKLHQNPDSFTYTTPRASVLKVTKIIYCKIYTCYPGHFSKIFLKDKFIGSRGQDWLTFRSLSPASWLRWTKKFKIKLQKCLIGHLLVSYSRLPSSCDGSNPTRWIKARSGPEEGSGHAGGPLSRWKRLLLSFPWRSVGLQGKGVVANLLECPSLCTRVVASTADENVRASSYKMHEVPYEIYH